MSVYILSKTSKQDYFFCLQNIFLQRIKYKTNTPPANNSGDTSAIY
jgi:hypothetical protein